MRSLLDETFKQADREVMPSRHMLALALAVLTAVRLLVAACTPLSPDEAYYWVWSQVLQPGYLDHPPMVALWIWLGTSAASAPTLKSKMSQRCCSATSWRTLRSRHSAVLVSA